MFISKSSSHFLRSSQCVKQSRRGVFIDKKDSFLHKQSHHSPNINPKCPASLRKKEILKEVYERCGAQTHSKLKEENNMALINKEMSQIYSSLELNSSRISPEFADFNQC